MNYPDSVQFLYALGNEIKTAKFGLERIRALLAALGSPHRRGRYIHVAGTNGKGSTCAMIEAGLRAAGFRTGLFTSPHLVAPVERIRIAGDPVSEAQFAAAFDRVHETAERLLRAGEIDFHPTYFETVTAMAFLLFEEVDIAVMEVGLGGRLDATNVITPEVSVITPIDFDHEAFLGKSLDAIAREKAGILKPGVPAVFAPQRPEAQAALDARAAELGITVVRTPDPRNIEIGAYSSRCEAGGMHIVCPLAGEHQIQNAIGAAVTLRLVGVGPEGIAQALWPGRLERVAERPEILLDGAHNPAGVRALARHLERFYAGRKIHLIYGTMRDKAIEEMTGTLFPLATRVIVTAPRQARAALPSTIAAIAHHRDLQIAPGVEAALAVARRSPPEDVILITGSLFLVGEAKACLSGS